MIFPLNIVDLALFHVEMVFTESPDSVIIYTSDEDDFVCA